MPFDQLLLAACSSAPVAANALPQATLAFEYNPTSDANLPGIGAGDNATVNTATDMTGNGRTGTQTASAGPERKFAAINGVNTFNFIQANLDSLLVGSGTTFSSGVYAIGIDGVFQFPAFSQLYQIIRIYTETSAANRFGVQVTTGGKIQVVSRREVGNANSTVTSTIGLTAGVQSFVSVQVDYSNGQVRVVIDDAVETLTASWSSGTGPTSSSPSSAAPAIGRIPSSSVAMNCYVGSIRCWTGSMPIADVQTQRMAMQAIFDTPLQTVAVDPPTSSLGYNKFYRSLAGVASVPVAGTVTIGADADIEMRLIDAATRVASGGWSTIATSSGLVWSATPSIPVGSWYLQFRKLGENDTDAITDTTNRVGVGFVILMIGLSNVQKFWAAFGSQDTRYSPYPIAVPVSSSSVFLGNRRWSAFGYYGVEQTMRTSQNSTGTNEPYTGPLLAGCGGNALAAFCLQLQTAESIPVMTLAYAVGGTAISYWVDGGVGWSNLVDTLEAPGAPGWDIDGTFLVCGEGDARDGTSYDDYYASLEAIHDQLRTKTGDANTKLWITAPNSSITSTTTDASMNAVLDASLQYIEDDADALFGYSIRDFSLSSDNLHPDREVYENDSAPRMAMTFRHDLGLVAGSGVGPEISGGTAAIGANSANITVTQHGGTTLVDGTGSASGTNLTGLDVIVDGTPRAILTSALNAGSIDLTWDGAATVASVDIANMRGRAPDTTNPIRDNQTIPGSSVGCPLQPTNGYFRITAT
jgi:hypothetical protein